MHERRGKCIKTFFKKRLKVARARSNFHSIGVITGKAHLFSLVMPSLGGNGLRNLLCSYQNLKSYFRFVST